ncbi:LysR family transcriptional regulator substrate-binding protein [Brevibacillus laterosporus]|uniref:LysR family transcriptional regulator substrate-binding protein n=1 Tax=Brevibacillus laterosporus TaxID=1465 RepID=UPI0023AAC9D8|nr:LysR family transcriptional regulator substrate-binding protein [Brevibacillus laterosporus]
MPLFDRIGKKIVLKRGGLTTVKLWYRYFGHVAKCQGLDCGSTTYSVRNHKSCIMLSDLDYRVGQLIIDFYHQFPKVNLMVIALIDILRQVLESEVDIGIGINVAPNDRLVTIPLCKEEYVLTVSKRHPLANPDLH